MGTKSVWEIRVRDHIQKAQEKQWLVAAKKNKKLGVYRKIKKNLVREVYLTNKNVNGRTALARVRSGEHCLAINTGRWSQPPVERSDRVCNWCLAQKDKWVVEDEQHFMMQCPAYKEERKEMTRKRRQVYQMAEMEEENDTEALFREVMGDYSESNIGTEEAAQLNEISLVFTEQAMKKRNEHYQEQWE